MIREAQARRMASFCSAFNIQPSEYRKLTTYELTAFMELATPKTDLTGLI